MPWFPRPRSSCSRSPAHSSYTVSILPTSSFFFWITLAWWPGTGGYPAPQLTLESFCSTLLSIYLWWHFCYLRWRFSVQSRSYGSTQVRYIPHVQRKEKCSNTAQIQLIIITIWAIYLHSILKWKERMQSTMDLVWVNRWRLSFRIIRIDYISSSPGDEINIWYIYKHENIKKSRVLFCGGHSRFSC